MNGKQKPYKRIWIFPLISPLHSVSLCYASKITLISHLYVVSSRRLRSNRRTFFPLPCLVPYISIRYDSNHLGQHLTFPYSFLLRLLQLVSLSDLFYVYELFVHKSCFHLIVFSQAHWLTIYGTRRVCSRGAIGSV